MSVGARMIADRLADPELGPVESGFLATLGRRFTELDGEPDETLYMDGAARLLSDTQLADLPRADKLMTALEGRASVLRVLRSALDERSSSSGSATRTRSPSCARSASSAPTTASPTATSARSESSARCGWTTRPRSPPCASAARELSRYCETVYGG